MIEIPDVPEEDDGEPKDLGTAYGDLVRGLKANVLPPEDLKQLAASFGKAAGLDKIDSIFGAFPQADWLPRGGIAVDDQTWRMPEVPIDTSRHETARNTERMAESLESQHEAVAELVRLTASSLALTTEQRQAAERSERFSRRTTITSVVIGAASLGASIAAIAVAVLVR